jgi:hypothetical protein
MQIGFRRAPEGRALRRDAGVGQDGKRSYEERQHVPGDYDAARLSALAESQQDGCCGKQYRHRPGEIRHPYSTRPMIEGGHHREAKEQPHP